MKIRSATVGDADKLLEIYRPYVENTAVSFEYEAPSLETFQNRIETTLKRYPYLVIEEDDVIYGYTYAGPFKGRPGYDHSVELSIYVRQQDKGKGCGRKLYEAIEKELETMGYLNLYACVAYPVKEDEYLTKNSAEFHAHLGFQKVGEFHRCAHKFGHWYDMIWMEKIIRWDL